MRRLLEADRRQPAMTHAETAGDLCGGNWAKKKRPCFELLLLRGGRQPRTKCRRNRRKRTKPGAAARNPKAKRFRVRRRSLRISAAASITRSVKVWFSACVATELLARRRRRHSAACRQAPQLLVVSISGFGRRESLGSRTGCSRDRRKSVDRET